MTTQVFAGHRAAGATLAALLVSAAITLPANRCPLYYLWECGGYQRSAPRGADRMQDLIYVICTIGFFVVAIAYVWACEKLK